MGLELSCPTASQMVLNTPLLSCPTPCIQLKELCASGKEALSLVFGFQKFHKYIYGRKFTLVTDHKPLTTIFSPKTGVPALAAARLQRRALLL